MKKLVLLTTAFLFVACANPTPAPTPDPLPQPPVNDTRTSSVYTTSFALAALQRAMPYSVYLPADYAASGLRYPVLYLLHGRGDDERSWLGGGGIQAQLDRLTRAGKIPPVIAIMPSAESSWYVDGPEAMETAITRDLVERVDATLRTLPEREGRAVVGYSMGGYGSVRYGLAHPELFGAAITLSGALYRDDPPLDSSARELPVFGDPFDLNRWNALNYPATLETFLKKNLSVPLFIAAGDDEYVNTRYVDNADVQATMLYAKLRKEGQRAQLRIVNGGHNWATWSPALDEGLPYIFNYLKWPNLTATRLPVATP